MTSVRPRLLFMVISSLILLACGCPGQEQRIETAGGGGTVTQGQIQAAVNARVEEVRVEMRAEFDIEMAAIRADIEVVIGGLKIGGTGNVVNQYVWLDKLTSMLYALSAPGSLLVYVLLHRTEMFQKLKHGRRYKNGEK